ncbi:MAG: DNA mismatch repair protein MutS [Chloroflexaceae bacterium]|nr:DNA mismatch repair protein MutS [Chloroflexaceae bacterium]
MVKTELHEWYRQFQQLKAEHPDAILLYRLGDFYEAFDDDAKLLAELLDVTLTRKDYAVERTQKGKSKNEQKLYAPMAGIPYHAVESYVARIVAQGYRVAIAEQISETASSKSDTRPRSVFATGLEQTTRQRGIVHREVVRVVTPGTMNDPAMLPATQNNYLAAVIADGDAVGLAYVDLSTGEFVATELHGERAAVELEGELARINVAEVLVSDDERSRLPGLAPRSAHLKQDLAPMTKDERELLLPHERIARRLEQEGSATWVKGQVTAFPEWRWELETAREALQRQLGVQSLAGFGLDGRILAIRAAGAVVQYIHTTQRSTAAQVASIRFYTTGTFMFLDPQTRRNLELLEHSTTGKTKGALVSVLDYTRTPMGARMLRRWLSQPLIDLPALQRRQDAVACCVDDGLLRAELREALGGIGDMERAVNRIVQGLGFANPRDLVQLRQALRAVPNIGAAVGESATRLCVTDNIGAEQAAMVDASEPANGELFDDEDDAAAFDDDADDLRGTGQTVPLLDPCSAVLELLERAIDDDPPALLGASNYLRADTDADRPRRVIRPGYDERMDQVIQASRDAQEYINNLEARERERTGIKSLKVDYNKVFGYFIEVSRSVADQVPSHYERKQTLVGAERYITLELKEYESIVQNAQQRLVELERDVFARLCAELNQHSARLRATAQLLAYLDVYAALGEAAVRGRYNRPTLNEGTQLQIAGGRHPVVERTLDEPYIANDITLDTNEQQLLIITGPNMAGKSTTLRQVALIVLLAQIGSFVPAEQASIGMVDRIFTRIGAQDDIATGRSTFMVEMTETAALLAQSTRRSLIILDEVGRGTSTYDGMAIARAVVEYIHNNPRLQCRTLFATHYHELTVLETLLPRVKNYHMAAVEQDGRVVFLYELRRGGADRSYGIHVAELAGIPRPVIRRATELLAELEQRSASPTFDAEATPPAPAPAAPPTTDDTQLSLFDAAPNPVVEYLKRLNIEELSPIEAMTRLYELQQMARQPREQR